MFFAGINDLTTLKKEYWKLVKIHHPDVGGDTATMQAINAEYTEAVKRIERGEYSRQASTQASANAEQAEQTEQEMPEEYINAISAVVGLADILVELVGKWIWVTGNTYAVKKVLKSAGYRWSRERKAWYWRPANYRSKFNKKFDDLDTIRSVYGSTQVTGEHVKARYALA